VQIFSKKIDQMTYSVTTLSATSIRYITNYETGCVTY